MDGYRSPRTALAAWRAELAATRRSPWLASLLLRQATALARRAAALHVRLAALPRRTRRRLAKQWAMALPVAAIALAWSGGAAEAATIHVGGGCTLIDAIHAANGDVAVGGCAAGSGADTIVLGGRSYRYRGPDNTYHGANAFPPVLSDITIEGQGATIERDPSADPAFRFFLTAGELAARGFEASDEQGALTLRDLELRGGYAKHESSVYLSGDGGSILSLGALRLERVTISGSEADGFGGAIAQRYAAAELVDSVVSGGDATAGGAIAVIRSEGLVMRAGVIRDNHAWNEGGGIHVQDSHLLVQGTNIASNTAEGYGGGLGVRGGIVTLRDARITDNESYDSGGGLHLYGYALDVEGSTIEGNRSHYRGGGIFAHGYPVRIVDSVFRENEAGSGGGLVVQLEATLSQVTFQDNLAREEGKGGGILALGDVTLIDATMSGNSALRGGALYNAGELRVLGGEMMGNQAGYGGGIMNDGWLTLTGTNIQGNLAVLLGGGLYNAGRAQIDEGRIEGNRAYDKGGGIFSGVFESGRVPSLHLQDSVVSENQAMFGGGIDIGSRRASTTIVNSELRGNVADVHGGGLSLYGEVELHGTTLADNSAYAFGGGVYNRTAELAMRDCTVTGNAAEKGAGVYNLSLLDLQDGTFAGNAAEMGGALFNRETATLRGATLRENTATAQGGAIYNAGDAKLEGLLIQGNVAGEDGGGIASDARRGPSIRASRVTGNVAGQRGGGVFDHGSYALSVEDSTLDGNEANRGGGIYAMFGVELFNSTLSGNRAEASGGGLHSYWEAVLTQVTLADNEVATQEGGGALFLANETARLTGSIVTGSGEGGDCAGFGVFVGEGNLVDEHAEGACAELATAAVTGLAPELAANGGPTLTRALLPESNALDVAPDCPGQDDGPQTTDQRGAPRPQDGDGDGEAACDIGAYERAPNWTLSVTIEGPGRGTVHGPAFLAEGIDCGEGGQDCDEGYANGMEVALDARPWPGWLPEWSGDCDAEGHVTMTADRACTVSFVADPTGGPIFLPVVIKE